MPKGPYTVRNITIGLAGANPNVTALDTRTGYVFVGLDPSYLVAISPATHTIVSTLDLGAYAYPSAIAFDSATNEIYVTSAALNEAIVISGANFTIVARVPVGTDPVAIVYDNVTGDMWVANFNGGAELTVIDGQTLQVIANVTIYASGPLAVGFDYDTREIVFTGIGFTLYGYMAAVYDANYTLAWGTSGTEYQSQPQNLICDPATNEIYVTVGPILGAGVFVFAGGTGQLITKISAGGTPTGIAFDNRSGMLYVADYGTDTVAVLNPSIYEVTGEISVLSGPGAVTYDALSNEVYVANVWSQAVSVINVTTGNVSNTIQVSASPIALVEDGALQAIIATGADQVLAISERNGSILGTAPVGLNPEGITYDNQTNELFVTNTGSNSVTVLSGSTLDLVDTIDVGNYPQGIAFDGATAQVFVACAGSNLVDVISPASHSVVARIGVGLGPTELAVDTALSELFVTEYGSDNVTVISTLSLTVIGSIYIGYFALPTGIALDPTTNELYVADLYRGNVSVISATGLSVIDTISVGGSPFGVVFDSNSSQVLVSNSCALTGPSYLIYQCGNNVTIISTALQAPVGSVVTGSPLGEAFSRTTGKVYVANFYSGTITVLTPLPPPTYPVAFEESGLASGTTWSITLNSTTESSVTTTITFSEPNGSYTYTIADVPGWHQTALPYSGSLTVSGSVVTEPTLAFTQVTYTATFGESGLPMGTSWSVTLSGVTKSSTATSITFTEPNGSYSFTVGSISGFTASPSSGTVTVNGVAQSQSITFATSSTSAASTSFPWIYVILGVVIAVVAAGVAVALVMRSRRR